MTEATMPKQSNVVRITEYQNRDTIEVCQEIIELAKIGEVTGMIFALREGDKVHGIGATGTYRDDPFTAKVVVGGLFDLFSRLGRRLVTEDDL
jgi:hypothetical protein